MYIKKRAGSPTKESGAEDKQSAEERRKAKEEKRKKEEEEEKKKKDPRFKLNLKIHEAAKNFKHYKYKDDYRVPTACKAGGFELIDPVIIKKYRDAAKDIISQMGRQILSGSVNLTGVTFPIKCMQH